MSTFHSRALFFILVLLALSHGLVGQEIVVKPYLQNAEMNAMTIMWETEAEGNGFVYWGLDPFTLDNIISSSSTTAEGDNQIHTVVISALDANSKYYYQVRMASGDQTVVYNFRTLPESSSEENVNFVAMSDMQNDGSNPDVYETIINNGIIPISNDLFPNGIEDLDGILIPGDLVGSSVYSSYRNTFFQPSENLNPYVPLYPVPGNHEYLGSGLPMFLDYFNLPLNGDVSNPEEWWYKDISNVRIIGLNSNSPGSEMTSQLSWLEDILDDAGIDDDIDFVFIQLHHPYKSELWTPGESDFTGDVIARAESFTENYEKPSIHFFGHTHGYSRGQSRDHNHLWVNVATAGGAIDNWGEFPNADYEEFSLSEDEYGFVMLEVEAGDEPQFVMTRYSQGDQDIYEDNTISDEIRILRYGNPPTTPVALFPVGDIPLDCISLQASEFEGGDNTHQATHWQIALGCDFDQKDLINIWRQSENWYNEINTQANDDLTDETVSNLMANENYCWRVRYRNEELNWSEWSAPLSFNTLENSGSSTGNLLNNNGAENGINNWSGDIESLTSEECNSVPTYQGARFFAVGGVCANEQAVGIATQDVDVSSFASEIDNEEYKASFGGFLRAFANGNDVPEMYLEFLGETDVLLGVSESVSSATNTWTNVTGIEDWSIPLS